MTCEQRKAVGLGFVLALALSIDAETSLATADSRLTPPARSEAPGQPPDWDDVRDRASDGSQQKVVALQVAKNEAGTATENRLPQRKYGGRELPDHAQSAFISTLLEAGAYKQALPYLRTHASRYGGDWLYVYAYAAKKSEGTKELAEFLETELNRTDLLRTAVQARVWALIEELPEDAIVILRKKVKRDPFAWLEYYATALQTVKDRNRRVTEARELAPSLEAELARIDLSSATGQARVWTLIETLPGTAVEILRHRAEQDPRTWLEYYAGALKKSKDGDRRLAEFITEAIYRTDLADADREWLLDTLPEVAGQQVALTHLKKLADSGHSKWAQRYEYELREAGDVRQLGAFLLQRGLEATAPLPERINAGYSLLELGRKTAAQQVFQALAANEPPSGSSVQELLFLWGPRPSPQALNWLAERAKRATTSREQAAWLGYMLDKGAAQQVVELIGTQFSISDPSFRDLEISAVAKLKQQDELKRVLERAIAAERELDRLARYAAIAQDQGFSAIAERAWKSVLVKDSSHARALKELGVLAFFRDDLSSAEELLTRYLEKTHDDFAATYYLAETLRSKKQRRATAKLYRRALTELRQTKSESLDSLRIEAMILSRLGEVDSSRAKFEQLLESRPADRPQVMEDYVQMLIDSGRPKEALDVLDAHRPKLANRHQ
ncbi:MAG: tetratricopeptide repeat protein [Gammaproteobacteria bacterium]